jgi:hypothetical protein
MSENHISARKKYWATISEEDRSNRMRELAFKKNKALTFKQKRDHSLKMLAAKALKQAVV